MSVGPTTKSWTMGRLLLLQFHPINHRIWWGWILTATLLLFFLSGVTGEFGAMRNSNALLVGAVSGASSIRGAAKMPMAFLSSRATRYPTRKGGSFISGRFLGSPSIIASTESPSSSVTKLYWYGRRGGLRLFTSKGGSSDENVDIENTDAMLQTRDCTRTTPFEWKELYDIVVVKGELSSLCRSRQDEERYGQERIQLSETYDSVYDFILYSKFQMPREWNTETQKWTAGAHTSTTSVDEPRTVLVPNDFPYFTAPGVEHWVLWKLGGTVCENDVDAALTTFRRDHNAIDTIHWENPPHLKSLPFIDHVHILVKTNTSSSSLVS